MQLQCLYVSARSVTLRIDDGGRYQTLRPYHVLLNGQASATTDTVVTTLFHLLPDTEYTLTLTGSETPLATCVFQTLPERFTLNVRRFGAHGDGMHNDTAAIQAAILTCPPESRVLIPDGRYLVSPIFLKSHLRLELAAGAELLLSTDRDAMAILPGLTQSWDEQEEWPLGTWEGNPLNMYAALLTGVDVEDVLIYGEGTLNGQAQLGDWWTQPKLKRGAWRGRLLFLNSCCQVTLQGLRFRNSPSWNIHPYFSQELAFYNPDISAPADSPNTDGFNPESCTDVEIAGAHFSLGDDCIAIKSGKLYMGQTYHTPSERILIRHCLMENGHGGVTVGSEMAGGVRDVTVQSCVMRNTDRGLRIKTRRGRGSNGVIDNIRFEAVTMDHVGVPCTVNALYACDPDGRTPYVQSREALPVDERTPAIGRLSFERITADHCGACAVYVLGLPEAPVEELRLSDVHFTFAAQPNPMQPVMALGVASCAGEGIILHNVRKLVCRNVTLEGQRGDPLQCEAVAEIDWEGQP